MKDGRYYMAGIAAFAIWGFFPIALRSVQDTTAGEILYFRILFSSVTVLVITVGFRRKKFREALSFMRTLPARERTRALVLTLAGGLLLTVNWLTYIYIVNSINIKTASFTYLICPVITAILGYLLLKEKITWLQWIAVGLCAVSCVLIGLASVTELGYSFLTAVSYALYLVSQRRNQWLDRMIVLGIQTIFAFLVLSVLYNYLVGEAPAAPGFFGVIIIIAVVFTVLPLYLNLYALQRITSATIGILMYLNPLINFVIAFTMFGETVYPVQVLGYAIIVIALIMFNYSNLKKIQTAAG